MIISILTFEPRAVAGPCDGVPLMPRHSTPKMHAAAAPKHGMQLLLQQLEEFVYPCKSQHFWYRRGKACVNPPCC